METFLWCEASILNIFFTLWQTLLLFGFGLDASRINKDPEFYHYSGFAHLTLVVCSVLDYSKIKFLLVSFLRHDLHPGFPCLLQSMSSKVGISAVLSLG